MAKQPLLSIITPSFNQAQFLEQSINSVLEQNYPRVEYLLIDGGSTDGSQEIIKKYSAHLAYWLSEPDHGQADAINKGFKRAKGAIVAWLNSDDYYLPNAFSQAVQIFQENPQVAFLYGDVLAVDAEGKSINLLRYQPWGLYDLMCFNIIGQPSVFIRKSFLEKTGYLDLSYKLLLDHHLWLRLAMLAPIKYVPVLLSAARYHPLAKNLSLAEDFGKEAYRIVDWMQTVPELKVPFEMLQKKIWAGAHRINARYLLDGQQSKAAFNTYLKCFSSDPITALKEWYRIVFAVLSMLGLGGLKSLHPRWRN